MTSSDGMLGAPVDVLAEDVRQLRARPPLRSLREAHGLARLGAQVAVDVLAHRAPVLRRDAHEHPDDLHRHLGAEVGDEVEPVGADQRVEALGGEVADLLFERGHPLRRERPREQLAVERVRRRVLEDQRARRLLDVRLDELEHVALAVDEGVLVLQRLFDVVVAAQRVEVVALVVVERRFLTQTSEDGIRVRRDLDVVGVEVEIRCGGERHGPPSMAPSATVGFTVPCRPVGIKVDASKDCEGPERRVGDAQPCASGETRTPTPFGTRT